MGVHGLWRLLDASGKPVPLETLEGKVLAIDVSIWIHQVLQGYQDRRGNAVPNAHLLGLFHRICKLLYFKIKPVFVFDGGVPMLKKNTIASRKKQKAIAATKAQQMKTDLIQNLIKHAAVKGALGTGEKGSSSQASSSSVKSPNSTDDMFKLPNISSLNSSQSDEPMDDYEEYDSDDSVNLSPRKKWMGNIHTVDVTSADFKALPADVRYNVLTDLKETRKQNSWGRLHELPRESYEFSDYQMKRLLKRRQVQESLETAEKEMGGKTMTLEELEKLLTDQGVDTKSRDQVFRIASDSTSRVIYVNNPKSLPKSSSTEEPSSCEISVTNSQQSEEKLSRDSGKDDSSFMKTPSESLIENINEYDLLDSDSDSENDAMMPKNSVEPRSRLMRKYFSQRNIFPVASLPTTTSSDSVVENIDEHASVSDRDAKDGTTKKFFGKRKNHLSDSVLENISDWNFEDDAMMPMKKMNPAVAYMLEYADLQQEEILALIEQDTQKSKSKGSQKLNEKNEKSSDEILASFLTPEKKSAENMENNCAASCSKTLNDAEDLMDITENCDSSVIEISSPQKDSKAESELKSSEKDNSPSTPKILSSDSDTDSDLVEIPDVDIPESKFGLEIVVKSDEALKDEDDIFADVFIKEPIDSSDVSTQDISTSFTFTTPKKIEAVKELSPTPEKIEAVKELSPTPEKMEIASPVKSQETGKKPIISSELIPSTNESEADVAITKNEVTEESMSKPSTSRADILSEQVAKFKPELLKANQEKLASMQAELESEHNELTGNIGKLERQATAVTDQMRLEAEDLLRLFGIPYIVAPMEAEAQCAYLESIELTDGTITDDSDIWLFGGRCVYKNFFNNNKRVMQYKLTDIQHHFKLSRQQMIQLALLVGSDYTVGVSGIGPVTALEILAAFPSEGDNLLNGLTRFSSWIKTGRTAGPGRAALRSKLRNVEIDKGFPSQAVVQAYMFPTVDESKETFTWNKPNLTLLNDYTRQKFGWTKLKFEETMGPVVKKLAEAKSQKDIMSYFRVNTIPKSIENNLSKRVKKAVERLGSGAVAGESNEEDNVAELEASGKTKASRKRKIKDSKKQATESGFFTTEEVGEDARKAETLDVGSEVAGLSENQVAKGNVAGTSALRNGKNVEEYIPQREKDKANALKKKLKAIEVFRKSKNGPGKTRKAKRMIQNIKKEANLSESSDSS